VDSCPDLSQMDCNAVTGAYKKLFRELPEPLLTFEAHDALLEASRAGEPGPALKAVLQTIPGKNYKIVEYLMRFLVEVSQHADVNKMAASNLGIVFGPTLMRNRDESLSGMMNPMNNPGAVIAAMITNCDVIFGEKKTKKRSGGKKGRHRPTSTKLDEKRPDDLLAKIAQGIGEDLRNRSKTDLGTSSPTTQRQASDPNLIPPPIAPKPTNAPPIAPKPNIAPPPKPNQAPPPIAPKPSIPPKPSAKPEPVVEPEPEPEPQPEPEPVVQPATAPAPALPPVPPKPKEIVVTLYDYMGDASLGQLSFSAGEAIEVLAKHESGWWTGVLKGRKGLFPSNFAAAYHEDEF